MPSISRPSRPCLGPRTGVLAASLLALLLAACAVPPPGAEGGAPGVRAAPDPVTSSDETEQQRRARLRLELAGAYYAEGQYSTALDEIKQALAVAPDAVPAHNLRGLIYAALADDARALDSFQRALALDPQDGDTLHNLGYFHCQRRRMAEAERYFQQALQAPRYRQGARTLLVQGVCASQAGDLPRAETLLKQAFDLDAANPVAAMNLAEVLYRRGDYERARFYVKRVNDRAELRNAESLWLLARIEHKLGNASLAQELGRQLRSRHPNAPETAVFDRGVFDD